MQQLHRLHRPASRVRDMLEPAFHAVEHRIGRCHRRQKVGNSASSGSRCEHFRAQQGSLRLPIPHWCLDDKKARLAHPQGRVKRFHLGWSKRRILGKIGKAPMEKLLVFELYLLGLPCGRQGQRRPSRIRSHKELIVRFNAIDKREKLALEATQSAMMTRAERRTWTG